MKKRQFFIALLGLAIFCGMSADATAQLKLPTKKKAPAQPAAKDPSASAEPDKILYDRALSDIKHGRYTEGRLSLQTLINTYPDSEYLAKAKLAVADSYYKEGGTSNLTQSVAEYKDFITFFPFLEEAAYAQMQVGMAHFKMMEKADRDSSQAQMAEDEFQAMLLKFPQSPYAPQAEQRLREVQEVLADGEYKIAHYYYTKQDFRASAARLLEVINRYPLYSQSDEALWMLGDIYSRVRQGAKNEDVRNYWAAVSGKVYDTIVSQYPLSPRAPDAKARLKQMGMPVPPPDPDALARAEKERALEKQHHESALLKTPKNMLRGAPDVSVAAHSGQPNLNPPDDAVAASEVLKPTSGVSGFTLSGSPTAGGSDSAPAAATDAPAKQEDAVTSHGVVESGPAGGTIIGVQIIQPPVAATSGSSDPAPGTRPGTSVNPSPSDPSRPSSAPAQPPANQPDAAGSNTGASSSSSSAVPAAQTAPAAQGSTSPAAASSTGHTDQSATDSSSNSTNQSASSSQTPTDDSKDSSSKKKKGIHKIIPW